MRGPEACRPTGEVPGVQGCTRGPEACRPTGEVPGAMRDGGTVVMGSLPAAAAATEVRCLASCHRHFSAAVTAGDGLCCRPCMTILTYQP